MTNKQYEHLAAYAREMYYKDAEIQRLRNAMNASKESEE